MSRATQRGQLAVAHLLRHAFFSVLVIRSVPLIPGRLALCLLAASASNARLGIAPERRSLYEGQYRTTYLLLSCAGQSLETAYHLAQVTRRPVILGAFLLVLAALALFLYVTERAAFYFNLRAMTERFLLQFGTGAVEVIWGIQLLWNFVHKGGLWSTALRIAMLVAVPATLIALYKPMCSLQNRISDRRIRLARGADGNARNAATCLPAEVQLLIFHLLRTRGRFGAQEHLPRDARARCNRIKLPFSGAGDLAAAARVCAAWRGAATEVLYHDAVLRSARYTCRFSFALKVRPELALLVRRIVLPDSERYAPSDKENAYRTPWAEFSAAIEHIVESCVGATDIRLFRDKTRLLKEIPGLSAASARVTRLAIHGGRDFYLERDYEPETVDLCLLLGLLPCLTSLTLTRQKVIFDSASLRKASRRALSDIEELYLGACRMDIQHLVCLLRNLPTVRIVELRDPEFSGAHRGFAVSELFAAQRGTLGDLRILLGNKLPVSKRRIVPELVLVGFFALRSLAVNARMLPDLLILPSGLDELVVSFAPYSCQDRSACRETLLEAVRAVRNLAPTARTLRSVQLWDDVRLAQLGHWGVASFMLREMLAPAEISVAVNLWCFCAIVIPQQSPIAGTINVIDILDLKSKFEQQKTLRRVLWVGII